MKTFISRLRLPLLCFAGLSALYLIFGIAHGMGMAHAAALAGNDVTIPTTTIDAGWNMVSTYGWTWGGMYLVFTMASWALAKNESTHWIAQGKTLAYLVGGVGIGIAALQAHFGGTPWSGVLMTVFMAVFKLLVPTTGDQPAPGVSASAAVKTTVLALLAISLGIAGSQMACSSAKAKAIESAIWDCTKPERAEAVDAITPAVISVIKAAGSADGKVIDLSTVKSAISKADLLSEAGILLSCAAANAFAILQGPDATPPAGSVASAPLVLDRAALRATWSQIASSQLGGAHFQTAHGAM